jgi:hypothetical protein
VICIVVEVAARSYLPVRGKKPALRSASSLDLDKPWPWPAPVLVPVPLPVALGPPAPPVVREGAIVVGVPGFTAPVLGALAPPGVPPSGVAGALGAAEPPGVAELVVGGRFSEVVGVAGTVIVVVIAGGACGVGEPALSLTSAAASTPNATAAITAIATIGARQLAGAARRVRAAAPQVKHHSWAGSSGAPQSGHAASTGALVNGAGVGGEAATALLNGSWRTDG